MSRRRRTLRDFNERPGCFAEFERDVIEAEFQAHEAVEDRAEAGEDRFERQQARWLTRVDEDTAA
jgi:hypothetical protein